MTAQETDDTTAERKSKYLPIRLIGDFEQNIDYLAKKWDCSKTAAVRIAVKRVRDQEQRAASA